MSESGPGSPDSGSAADAKAVSVECPTCNDVFTTDVGMKCHHARVHGVSLARRTKECKICGDKFEFYPSKGGENRPCCSKECAGKWRSIIYTGENNKRWNKKDVECEICGDIVTLCESHAEKRRFCSKACFHEHLTTVSGEDHPQYDPEFHIQLECEQCGGSYEATADTADISRFCSQECMAEFQSENWVGDGHPKWMGGGPWYYGPNWDGQSEKARERDGYQCQGCGKPQGENGRKLPVHHIRRINWFRENYDNPEWYRGGNRLENLVTLCTSCHPRWEGIPLKPQVEN